MDKSSSSKNIMIIVGAIILGALACYAVSKYMQPKPESTSTTQERFAYRRQEIPTPVQPQDVTRPQGFTPQFDAPLAPRFDGTANQPILGAPTPIPNQASPVTPSPVPPQESMPNFAQLGGVAAPVPSGAITSKQASDILEKRFGTEQPKFIDTVELMPVPDMRYTAGVDPTDPQSFMYDRTIFGKLKRRYGNDVDYFRGDIDVKPEYRGWFDLQPPTDQDVVTGYFNNYIDVQQETAIRDSQFERNTPVAQLFKSTVNPWGDENRYAYNRV